MGGEVQAVADAMLGRDEVSELIGLQFFPTLRLEGLPDL